MNLARVKTHFDDEAPAYDANVRACVPGYEAQNETLAAMAPFAPEAALSILDLGAGTGVLIETLLARFPRAAATAFDFSENMLREARTRLAPFGGRVAFRRGDFAKNDLGGGYDLVVSGLALHHLDDPGKRALYRRVFAALRPGGALLIRDVILGATDALTAHYIGAWTAFMRRSGQDVATTLENYRREDLPARMTDHLRWLDEAGFVDVDCHWRCMNFAVFGGRKSAG